MTYRPLPQTVLETKFGPLHLVVHGPSTATVFAGNADAGPLTVNGVDYWGRIEFERVDGQAWRITQADTGHRSYENGISLKRQDDWRKGISDAARRKVSAELPRYVEDFLAGNSEGLAMVRKATEISTDGMVERAERKVSELEAQLDEARAELEQAKRKASEILSR